MEKKTNIQNQYPSNEQKVKRKIGLLKEKKKKKRIKTTAGTTPCSTPELPHEVVLDILCLLPPKCLTICILVCKRWSDSILNDSEFAIRQFRHYYQNNPPYLLVKFEPKATKNNKYNLNYLSPNVECQFFSIDRDGNSDDYQVQSLGTMKPSYAKRLIGFCNGLVCLYRQEDRIFEVCNTTRHEILGISSTQLIDSFQIICYGFGFDSLTNEYKVVVVYEQFRCMVFTLGSNLSSWREIQIKDICESLLLDRLLNFKCQLDSNRLSAIFCNGALVWKKNCDAPSEILMFNLHDEMFQIIKLPDEYVYPYHLFEHKGSLCVARGGNYFIWNVRVHALTKENYKYNDDEGEVVKPTESYIVEKYLLPVLSSQTPRSKSALFLTLDDQILLHRLENKSGRMVLYNVGTKESRLVKLPDGIGSKTHDYSANNHMWNFLSLKTFLQEGVHKIMHSYPSPQDVKRLNKQERNSDIAFFFSPSQNKKLND